MKISKLISIILTMTMLLSLASCNGNTNPNTDDTTEAPISSAPESTTPPPTPTLSTYSLAESTEHLKLYGRVSASGDGLACDFTASGIEMCIYIEGELKLGVSATADTYFTVFVDGKRTPERLFAPGGKTSELVVASFESGGTHKIRILKQTEARFSLSVLTTLNFFGYFEDAVKDSGTYIEFIGDSIVCGHGNLCTSATSNAGTALYEDGTVAFPYITAEALGADLSVVGCSGIGIAKGFTDFTESAFYDKLSYFRDKTKTYSFSRVPDLVVINLGTNDHIKGSGEDEFKAGVKALIELVRTSYGQDVRIVWTHNMMMDEREASYVADVFAAEGGESAGLYMCSLGRNTGGGNGHPTKDAHAQAALTLLDFISTKELLG